MGFNVSGCEFIKGIGGKKFGLNIYEDFLIQNFSKKKFIV